MARIPTIEELMSREPSLRGAPTRSLDALPVVDQSWRLLGVNTETDRLRALRGLVAAVSDGKARSSA